MVPIETPGQKARFSAGDPDKNRGVFLNEKTQMFVCGRKIEERIVSVT